MRPVIVDVARMAMSDMELNGYAIARGSLLIPAIALVHLRADVYEDPDAFVPERFLDGQPEPYTWIPFGGGVRRCLGAAFATFEMKVVLRAILSSATLRAARPQPERARVVHIMAVPADGAVAVLESRAPARASAVAGTPAGAAA